MKTEGLFRSIINAVIQEEKKRYTTKPRDLFIDQKKQHWYRIMDFIDELDAEDAQAKADSETPNM